MISIYQLKPAFQNSLRPLSNGLVSMGFTPNIVTLFTCTASLVVALLLYVFPDRDAWALALPLFMFVRMALNAIDGMMAKEHRMQTPLGCILNETTDVIADCALFVSLTAWSGLSTPLLILITLLSVMTEFVGNSVVQLGVERRHDGPMGKSDRAFVFSVIVILAALGFLPAVALNTILGLVCIFLVTTCIKRASAALALNKSTATTHTP